MASLSFGKQQRPAGKEFRDGTVGEALDDLYSDVEEAISKLESLSGLPQLTGFNGSVSAATGSSSLVLLGSGFLGGSALAGAASVLQTAETADSALKITAKKPGVGGNKITVKFVHPGAGNNTLAVADSGNDVTITLGTANGVGDSTGANIIAAINHIASGSALICAENAAAHDGSGVWTTVANDAKLAGGSGDDRTVAAQCGDQTVSLFSAISDTSISVMDGGITAAVGAQGNVRLLCVKTADTFSNQGITATLS